MIPYPGPTKWAAIRTEKIADLRAQLAVLEAANPVEPLLEAAGVLIALWRKEAAQMIRRGGPERLSGAAIINECANRLAGLLQLPATPDDGALASSLGERVLASENGESQ